MKNYQRRISIVIPTYNGMGTIERAIQAIFEKTTYPNFELIVVDDGSTDGTEKWINDYKKNAKLNNLSYFRFAKNRGACTALNKGIELAQKNDLIRIDNDVIIITGDWIDRFVRTAYSNKKIGIVSAKLLRDSGKVHSYEILAITKGYVPYPDWDAPPGIFKRITEVESNILACAYIKNDVTSLITNDEGYNPCWIDDIDYCINARYHGFKIIVDNNNTVYHTLTNRDRSKFEGEDLKRKWEIHDKNCIYFQNKWWKFGDRSSIIKKYAACPEITKFFTLKHIIRRKIKDFRIFCVYTYYRTYRALDRTLGLGGIFLKRHLPALYRFLKKEGCRK